MPSTPLSSLSTPFSILLPLAHPSPLSTGNSHRVGAPDGPCPTGFERVNGSCEGELGQGWEGLGPRAKATGRSSLSPLGPHHPSPQMWMSARPVGAASTGSVRTRMVGTRACALTASCWTHPAAAASVSHQEGAEAGSHVLLCSQTSSQNIPGPFISVDTPRSSKTPRSLIRSLSGFLDLLWPFLRTFKPFGSRSL